MPNENDEVIVDEVEDTNEDVEETTEEAPKPKAKVEKPKRTPQEEFEYHQGRANRLAKKLGINSEPEKTTPNSFELDYGQKAFLKSYDIKGADELELAKNWAKRTGDPLDSIVEDELFLAKLKSLRDARETANATPKSTKRSSAGPRDDLSLAIAEYHNSGKLPESLELRNKVWDSVLSKENKPFHNS